jgi:hypothetical protein
MQPEIYDIPSDTWSGPLAAAVRPRLYHSVAILLPSGEVRIYASDCLFRPCLRASFGSPHQYGRSWTTPLPACCPAEVIGRYNCRLFWISVRPPFGSPQQRGLG